MIMARPRLTDEQKKLTGTLKKCRIKPRLKGPALDLFVPVELEGNEREYYAYLRDLFLETDIVNQLNKPALVIMAKMYNHTMMQFNFATVDLAQFSGTMTMLRAFGALPKYRQNFRPIGSDDQDDG